MGVKFIALQLGGVKMVVVDLTAHILAAVFVWTHLFMDLQYYRNNRKGG